jgi:hypothetical protein
MNRTARLRKDTPHQKLPLCSAPPQAPLPGEALSFLLAHPRAPHRPRAAPQKQQSRTAPVTLTTVTLGSPACLNDRFRNFPPLPYFAIGLAFSHYTALNHKNNTDSTTHFTQALRLKGDSHPTA